MIKERIINADTLNIPENRNKVITYSLNSAIEGKEVIKITMDNHGRVVSKELYRTDSSTNMLLFSEVIHYTEDHQIESRKKFHHNSNTRYTHHTKVV